MDITDRQRTDIKAYITPRTRKNGGLEHKHKWGTGAKAQQPTECPSHVMGAGVGNVIIQHSIRK